jgi:hypothetical protein
MGYRHEAGSVEFVDPDTGHWKGGEDDLDEMFEVIIPGRIESFFAGVVTMLFYEVSLHEQRISPNPRINGACRVE